jgi:energy-coupling factor transport system permease protein
VHPAAWWVWAIGIAAGAARTTNPLVLALMVAVMCLVVALRRSDDPWARGFRLYLALGAVVIVVRTGFRVVFAGGGPTVLMTLPKLDLGGGLAGVSLGGPVSAEALASGLYGGMQLAAMIVCVGAAGALANPKRLLVALPGALEELGAVLVVAVSVFPQLAESVARVHRAKALRAGAQTRRRVIKTVLMPVLVDAMDRCVNLAAAMDSRGYGRRGAVSAAGQRATSAVVVGAVVMLGVGAYALLDTSGTPAGLGAGLLAAGLVAAGTGLHLAGRRAVRSRYRPERWGWVEWVTSASGAAVACGFAGLAAAGPAVLHPVPAPGIWPVLTIPAVLAIAAAALPLVVTRPPAAPIPLPAPVEVAL